MTLSYIDREVLLDRVLTISDRDLHAQYDSMLDDCHDSVVIAGYQYDTSNALKAVDPIAYRCGFSDWLSDDQFLEIEGEYYNTEELQTEYDKMMDGE